MDEPLMYVPISRHSMDEEQRGHDEEEASMPSGRHCEVRYTQGEEGVLTK